MTGRLLISIFILIGFNSFSQENNYKTKEEARVFINKKFESIKSIFRIDKNYIVYVELKDDEKGTLYSSADIKKVFISTESRGNFAFNLDINCVTGDCWKEKTQKGVITYHPGFGELMTNKEAEVVEQIIEAFQFIQTKILGYAPTKHK